MDSAIKRTVVLAEDEKSARDFVHFMELKKKKYWTLRNDNYLQVFRQRWILLNVQINRFNDSKILDINVLRLMEGLVQFEQKEEESGILNELKIHVWKYV